MTTHTFCVCMLLFPTCVLVIECEAPHRFLGLAPAIRGDGLSSGLLWYEFYIELLFMLVNVHSDCVQDVLSTARYYGLMVVCLH